MAVLDATNRFRVRAGMMRLALWPGNLSKADLDAAVAATDNFIDSNQMAFNAALPVASRTAMSVQQKTLLFCYVAMRRAGIFDVQEDHL